MFHEINLQTAWLGRIPIGKGMHRYPLLLQGPRLGAGAGRGVATPEIGQASLQGRATQLEQFRADLAGQVQLALLLQLTHQLAQERMQAPRTDAIGDLPELAEGRGRVYAISPPPLRGTLQSQQARKRRMAALR